MTCATYNLLTKWALTKGSVNPLVYCFYRDVCACPLLFAAAVLVDGKQPVPARSDLLRMSMLGLTGLFGNQVLFILGMQRTSPFIAAVVSQTQPVFSALLAMAYVKLPLPISCCQQHAMHRGSCYAPCALLCRSASTWTLIVPFWGLFPSISGSLGSG